MHRPRKSVSRFRFPAGAPSSTRAVRSLARVEETWVRLPSAAFGQPSSSWLGRFLASRKRTRRRYAPTTSIARLGSMADRPFGKGQAVDRNHYRAPRSTSPTGRGVALRMRRFGVRISGRAPIHARVAQWQRPLAQNKFRCGFESRLGYHAPCARWEGIGFTCRHDAVRSREGVPFRAIN